MLNAEFPEFPTKSKARAHVKSLGYTKLIDVTESGDYGYGSREYYRKPSLNDGFVREASISKVGSTCWFVNVFDEYKPNDPRNL